MIQAILTDIEGTTSSIHFVKEVLFPYARKHIPDFVREHFCEPEIRAQLNAIWQAQPELHNDLDATISQLLDWIDQDLKRTPLKTLQGMIWKRGYVDGAYRAHIYPDAVACLREWQQQGIALYVYSSGSIVAQQLFFQYSEAGDLRSLFQGYFDTTSGAKQSSEAYANILEQIQLPAQDVLFLSDIEAELNAAQSHGIQTCWLTRPQDCPLTPEEIQRSKHPAVSSFKDIKLERLCC
ncbi:MAG: acireductone synthase [Oleiphilus sp.]|nr:MAG: acireductone synthase [Oleiphilus sp.]